MVLGTTFCIIELKTISRRILKSIKLLQSIKHQKKTIQSAIDFVLKSIKNYPWTSGSN